VSTDNGAVDPYGDGCDAYAAVPAWCGGYDDADFVSEEMCCACGGGSTSGDGSGGDEDQCELTIELTGFRQFCVGAAQGSYLGSFPFGSLPEECIPNALAVGCETFMFSTENPTWGCRCCDDPSAATTHGKWDLYTIEEPCGTETEVCEDTDNGAVDSYDDPCSAYNYYPSWCGGYDDADFISEEMCCICGGGEIGSGSTSGANSINNHQESAPATLAHPHGARTSRAPKKAAQTKKKVVSPKVHKHGERTSTPKRLHGAAAKKAAGKAQSKSVKAKMPLVAPPKSVKPSAEGAEAKKSRESFTKHVTQHKKEVQAHLKAKHEPATTFKLASRLRQIKDARGEATDAHKELIMAKIEARKLRDARAQMTAAKAARAKKIRGAKTANRPTLTPEAVVA